MKASLKVVLSKDLNDEDKGGCTVGRGNRKYKDAKGSIT